LIVRHATDLVEHSELVADRLITFTEIVGQENVIAGTTAAYAAASIRTSPGPSCAPARRHRDREQEVVELNSKVPARDERNEKQESLEVKI
jgi:hypothetical protein